MPSQAECRPENTFPGLPEAEHDTVVASYYRTVSVCAKPQAIALWDLVGAGSGQVYVAVRASHNPPCPPYPKWVCVTGAISKDPWQQCPL